MRYIPSRSLSQRALTYLARWTDEIRAAAPGDQKTVGDARWKASKQLKTLKEIKRVLERMNGPLGTHCMYCEYNEAAHIDHFEPRASDPLKTFDWDNLHLACDLCDSNHKRDRFLRPEDGVRPLSPRQDYPPLHLRMLPSGAIDALSDRGDWSVDLFGLKRLRGYREDQWTTLRVLIPAYADAVVRGEHQEAKKLAQTVRRGRFLSILRELLAAAQGPKYEVLQLRQVRRAIEARPEILRWRDAED